ncbi:MAG: 3-octaprenyl-4-hydroxybenzoate carboxy-lyase [Flavobacteriales bacterium]|nr:3-octaprenyl-4-hydroxybenzoate carboxy-lyase [Flavobacteriales bacterium]
MAYKSINDCVLDLEKNGMLIRIKEEVDPNLEMSAIHQIVFKNHKKAVLFENVKGSRFAAVSNLFATLEQSQFIFRDTLKPVKGLVSLKADPANFFKTPLALIGSVTHAPYALPIKHRTHHFEEIQIEDIPQIKCWPMDGGPFVTLPQVYSEDIDKPGIMNSNLGMYRIQLGGNDYVQNKEIGLHYQIHRGIGVHQSKANANGQPLKVSIFVGGPPAHSLAAVMPLPEGMSEMTFAGIMGGRNFRYVVKDGFTLSKDSDFVICGEINANDVKPEGPFGDHLGYYSLTHDFPVMKIHKVYAKKDAIWPFTVVGRPPQEDSQFGALIHDITDGIIPTEIPGLKAVNAVDEAGVHPLLLAIGSERYTPYQKTRRPQELLTIANHILGKGQLSLAKYLFIVAQEDDANLDVQNEYDFFQHLFSRVDWSRDLHFQTKTTMDTLDYSSTGEINEGSKVVCAAVGEKKRELCNDLSNLLLDDGLKPHLVMPGVLVVESEDVESVKSKLEHLELEGIALITLVDDSAFVAEDISNWLWVTFTRSNPAEDIFGLDEGIQNKHWHCRIPIIDARVKPHHAPAMHMPDEIVQMAHQKINNAL